MWGKNSKKIDPFYLVLGLTLIVLTALVLFTLISVFNGISIASEFDSALGNAKTKIDAEKLDKAYELTIEKEILKFDLVQ